MSHPYDGLPCCEECGQKSDTADMVYIPEESGYYVICRVCEEAISDQWEKMQRKELMEFTD